jgi:3'-phosphoadenosine 5'-phosphosulfate (PAPS) 3'-phosphatase
LAVKQTHSVEAEYKDAKELVTTADKRSDAAILRIFQQRFTVLDSSIVFQLEESGFSNIPGSRIAGADPLDGTNHFAAGGNMYSIQAHYVEAGVPQVGIVFQPEIYLPLDEDPQCLGRVSYAIRGGGAFVRRSRYTGQGFELEPAQPFIKRSRPSTRSYVACVPISTKMSSEERDRAIKVLCSGLIATTTGTGGAGGNILMAVHGGQHVYANFGAGEDLDLIPPQVIAEEAGMTVWGIDRVPPVWNYRKQPVVVAPSPEIAELFLRAAGF